MITIILISLFNHNVDISQWILAHISLHVSVLLLFPVFKSLL